MVELLDSSGTVIETTNPDSNGFYEFVNLEPGDYIVREINDPDYPIDISDQDEMPDGDAGDSDSTVDNRIVVSLTAGEVDEGNDFVDAAAPTSPPTLAPIGQGSPSELQTAMPSKSPVTEVSEPGTVTGVIFEDTNGNGVKDPEEDGIPGVKVVITDSNGDPQTVTTNSNGEYSAVVPPGPTVIDIDETTLPPGAERTAGTDPTSVDVPSGGTASDVDGFQFPTGSPTKAPVAPTSSPTRSPTISNTAAISGSVTNTSGAGLPAAVVELLDSSGTVIETTNPDSNGFYEFVNLEPGDYIVREINDPDYPIDISDQDEMPDGDAGDSDSTVDNLIVVSLIAGEVDEGNDFVDAAAPTGTPTGSPTKAPTAAAVVTGSPTSSPTSSPTPVLKGCIKGTVTDDRTGDGLEGATIKLLDSSNNVIMTTSTDANGDYEFTDVPEGTYTVQETNPPGYPDDVGESEAVVTIDSEACKEGVDFVDEAPTGSPTKAPVAPTSSPTRSPTISNTAAISGSVTNTSGEGLPASVVELLDSSGTVIETTNPDSNGFYEFVNLEPGDYIVREINDPDYPIDISDQDEMPDGDAGDSDSTVDNRIVVYFDRG